jgi:hypothetical protein
MRPSLPKHTGTQSAVGPWPVLPMGRRAMHTVHCACDESSVLHPSPPSDTTQPRARTTQCSTHLPQATASATQPLTGDAVARYHFRTDQSTRSRATTTSKRRCPTTSSGGTSPTAHRQPSRPWTSFSAVASRRSGSQVGGYRTTRHLGRTEGWCPTLSLSLLCSTRFHSSLPRPLHSVPRAR